MEYLKYKIRNFKGARAIDINLEASPRANIFPLVGLNESGKSTILEALSHTGPEYIDFKKQDPIGQVTIEDALRFIPISEKYNFTGQISVESTIRFSKSDRTKISKWVKEQWGYTIHSMSDTFTIMQYFNFKDSQYVKQGNTWSLGPLMMKPRGRKAFSLPSADWLKLALYVRSLMPKVLFFRNELFDIPDKIYIGKAADNTDYKVNNFYREVVQDILHAVDPALDIDEHIIARKKSVNASDRQILDAILLRMGTHMTRTVMQQWEKIFNRKLEDKSIRIGCDVDENNLYYLHIRLFDGHEIFNINERSTGFRWFFVFILLTQYRGYRHETAIFLYDEPASNLHSSAQQQLLECFARLPNQFTIIYSTHSHYLIKPEWLDNTFVVKNEGAGELEDIDDIDLIKTNVKMEKYRTFVSNNPNGSSYFQPILDVLQYSPSRYDFIKNAVLVEGKSDFYFMTYMADVHLKVKKTFDIMPCMGSGTADQLIALYAGWGKDFIVLLDADNEGNAAKKRYIDKFGTLVADRIITYSDIEKSWDKAGLERIAGTADSQAITRAVFPEGTVTKKNLSLAVQELLYSKKTVKLEGDAGSHFATIFNYLEIAFLA